MLKDQDDLQSVNTIICNYKIYYITINRIYNIHEIWGGGF